MDGEETVSGVALIRKEQMGKKKIIKQMLYYVWIARYILHGTSTLSQVSSHLFEFQVKLLAFTVQATSQVSLIHMANINNLGFSRYQGDEMMLGNHAKLTVNHV